jgi:hypothetical protein
MMPASFLLLSGPIAQDNVIGSNLGSAARA